MRGLRVKWSPDSPRDEAVKPRAKRGNPEVFRANYKCLPRGNPHGSDFLPTLKGGALN